jgi:hypothetical protein
MFKRQKQQRRIKNITNNYAENTIFNLSEDIHQLKRNNEQLKIWLERQIYWSWQNRLNAEANAFELTLNFINKVEKETL